MYRFKFLPKNKNISHSFFLILIKCLFNKKYATRYYFLSTIIQSINLFHNVFFVYKFFMRYNISLKVHKSVFIVSSRCDSSLVQLFDCLLFQIVHQHVGFTFWILDTIVHRYCCFEWFYLMGFRDKLKP